MNLFVIPSWYPNPVQPVAGVFTMEQVHAIAEICPDINVIVSTWGHDQCHLTIEKILQAGRVLRWFCKQGRNIVRTSNKVTEIFNPAITWSRTWPSGGVTPSLLNANRKNLNTAQDRFGKIDLIHAHVSFPAGYIAAILSREFGIPYVITEHMSPFPFHRLTEDGRPVEEIDFAINHASATIAVSPFSADQIESFGYKRPHVMPNMVDERRFRVNRQLPSQPFVFFTLCGMSAQKGIDHLLQSIAQWNPDQEECRFVIGGQGKMLEAYKKMASQLGIGHLVHWPGLISRESAPDYFQHCHAYVMPSRHESFGIVCAEAIASGKPVIATRCGGPESIVNDKNGLLVDIGDVEALTKAMRYIKNNWQSYRANDIRKDFEQRFSRPVIVQQLCSLYSTVLSNR